ncbi:hypothetical protein [Alkaliphilus transvaalensis]|uniref:hypothetical protein n=1 Tax=Alkaliphilus transvaalensis TaxID=114628 RepID=UPI00047B75FC|nr:hypothetical protein [Alkaliphilus transvaalensis]
MKKKLIILFAIVLIFATGCRQAPQDEVPPPAPETPQAEENVDRELTEELVAEDEVINGQVYEQDDVVIGTMIIEEGVSQEDIDRIANKYADQLKEKYPNKRVNVQAVQGGQNVANIMLE